MEVVVNVDHPQDADAWLDWAYNKTQGLVVPVFSHNVHELRCGVCSATFSAMRADPCCLMSGCSQARLAASTCSTTRGMQAVRGLVAAHSLVLLTALHSPSNYDLSCVGSTEVIV